MNVQHPFWENIPRSWALLQDGQLPRRYTKDLLFHYTKGRTAIEKLFETMKVRMGPLVSMNDPRETDLWRVGWNMSEFEVMTTLVDDEPLQDKLSRDIDKQLKQGCNLFCLTKDQPGKGVRSLQGYAHDRMWAQYAEDHSGVCVFFDKKKLTECMRKHFKPKKGQLLAKSIQYVDSLDFGRIHVSGTQVTDNEHEIRRHRHEYAQKLYMTKTPDWKSEQEFRYLWISDEPSPPEAELVPIEDSVVAICAGVRFPAAYDINLEGIAKRIGCDLFRIFYLQGRLKVRPFDRNYPANLPQTIGR